MLLPLLRLAAAATLLFGAVPARHGGGMPHSAANPSVDQRLATAAQRAGLRSDLLRLGLAAYRRTADQGLAQRQVLTLIDFRLPSHERRLWVLDLAEGRVLAHELVAHGRGSGDDLATRFSNRAGSYESSLGTFVTAGTYRGKHGLSLRLRGLDDGVNDHALARAIVVHGAWYVSPQMIERYGRLGRSEGCPALSPQAASRVIGLIKGGSVLFAYYPSPELGQAVAAR